MGKQLPKYLFFGSPHSIEYTNETPTMTLHCASGENAGNVLIGQSVRDQLIFDEEYSGILDIQNITPEEANEKYAALIIPSSNFLNPFQDFGIYADFFARLKIPFVVIGLGSQAPVEDVPEIPLLPGQLRFIREIAAHSTTIGVRGEFTAECLKRLGINNVDVIGCPSFFLKCNPLLTIRHSSRNSIRLAINGDIKMRKNPELRSIFTDLCHEGFRHGASYFIQDEYPLAVLARRRADEMTLELGEQVLRFFFRDGDQDLLDYLRTHLHVYYNTSLWSDVIRSFDFSIGPRFHGNLIAVINGVPALFIIHDSRTRELCRYFRLPSIETRQVTGRKLIPFLFEVDYSETVHIFPERYMRYALFLDKNGLAHKLY